jgi:hypothetical protein
MFLVVFSLVVAVQVLVICGLAILANPYFCHDDAGIIEHLAR